MIKKTISIEYEFRQAQHNTWLGILFSVNLILPKFNTSYR